MTYIWTLRSLSIMWLIALAAIVAMSPALYFQAGLLTMLLVVGVLALLVPALMLGLAVFSLFLSPENFYEINTFVENSFSGLTVHSVHKLVIVAAMLPMIFRFRVDFKPNWGLMGVCGMLAVSMVASTKYPALDNGQIVRSFIALSLPFAFFNLQFRRGEIERMLLLIALFPLISLIAGGFAQIVGMRDSILEPWVLVVEEYTGALRLQGVNIPAYLAFFSFVSFVVCLWQAFVYKKKVYFLLGLVALFCIILSGTRMPSALAILFAGFVIMFTSGRDLSMRAKIGLSIIGAGLLAAVLVVYWPNLEARMGGSATGEAVNSSGRETVWPIFEEAISKNPLFGRGVGTGAILLLEEQEKVRITAAHNEYLRLLVDVGVVGTIIYFLSIGLVMWKEGAAFGQSEWVMVIGLGLCIAVYSYTDNTLTSPPTLVLFLALALLCRKARYMRDER